MDISYFGEAWIQQHPRAISWMILLLIANMIFKAIVDSLVAVKAAAKTAYTADQTGFDKFVTTMQLCGLFLGKIAGYVLLGMRSTPKAAPPAA